MADRGFTISESVGLKQAKLEIPAFTKGKSQLDPEDVENTRGIANVRIHVERVIGLLRRKYTILEGTLPTEYFACKPNGPVECQIPLIDRIVRICAALFNRPFPSSKKLHFQNEAKCETFVVEMSFICIIIKTQFHNKGFALSLILKVKLFGTQKWPISVHLSYPLIKEIIKLSLHLKLSRYKGLVIINGEC